MRYFQILLFLSFFFQSFGQEKFYSHDYVPGNILSYKPAYQDDFPQWAKMLYQENPNFHVISELYDKWSVNDSETFKSVVKYYKLWEMKVLPFVDEEGQIQLPEDWNSFNQFLPNAGNRNGANGPEWEFLGPKETFWLNESGSADTPKACPWQVNIYTFDVAPTNYSTIYCGTETGFVNKSTDNGLNWTLMGQDYAFGGGVTSIDIHPLDENTVYATAGNQIHKTVDGGQTWSPLLPSNGQFGNDHIMIHPVETERILAAGPSGVHVSNDGGATWTNVWSHQSYDIHTKPDDPNIVYTISSINGDFGVAISEDGGMTFTADSNFPDDVQNSSGGLLAVSPDSPDELFAICLSANNTPYLYKGDMTQITWELIATGQTNDFQLNNGQGFFDLVLEVSPIDADIIFAGTTTLYKSTNGGDSFFAIGGYGGPFPIHPDIQCMKLLDNGEAWVSTDGGFTYSTDNFSSTDNADARNKNLIGSDMWGFDQGWNEDVIVGGRYHNGNTAIADFYQPKALRMGGAESPTGWVMKGKSRHVAFNDLGAGWILPLTAESQPEGRFIFSKYPNMDEYGGRRGNLLFHPNYYEVIYIGEGNGFWKSEDMGVSFELLNDFGNRIRFIQISVENPNVIYADVQNRGLYKSEDGGYTWEEKPSLTSGAYGTSYWEGKLHFVISPNDANTIYACLQNGTWSADIGKIFKSNDGGDTWVDWTGTLNDYTKTLAIQPDSNGDDLLYLFTNNRNGAAAQCYIRKTGELDWEIYGDEYPAGLNTNHALPFFRDSKIRVAGNGGIWENELAETEFKPIIQPWVNKPFLNCMLDTIQFEDHSILNHENCTWQWNINPEPLYIDDENKRNPLVVLGSPGTYDVTLIVIKDGMSYSKTITEMVTTTECPSIDNCDNPALLPKSEWELVYVNSEEVNAPGLAIMSFDDDPSTIWHTRWSTGSDPYPHEIQIDLGDVYEVHDFIYLPRQVGQNGWIKDYELYFSEDLADWGVADTIGAFESSAAPHRVSFPTPKVGQYFRLVALSEANGNVWASAAEFDIRGCFYEIVSSEKSVNYERLKAFPIPTQNEFKISLPSNDEYEYTVLTVSGQIIKKGKSILGENVLNLNFSNFESGVYIVQLKNGEGPAYFIKTVKE